MDAVATLPLMHSLAMVHRMQSWTSQGLVNPMTSAPCDVPYHIQLWYECVQYSTAIFGSLVIRDVSLYI